MSDFAITGLLILSLFALLGSGVWIGLTLTGVAWIGMQLFSARPAGDAMAVTIWGSASGWTRRRSSGLPVTQPLSLATLNRARRLTRMLSAVVAVFLFSIAQACSLSRNSMPMVRLTVCTGRSPISLTN